MRGNSTSQVYKSRTILDREAYFDKLKKSSGHVNLGTRVKIIISPSCFTGNNIFQNPPVANVTLEHLFHSFPVIIIESAL